MAERITVPKCSEDTNPSQVFLTAAMLRRFLTTTNVVVENPDDLYQLVELFHQSFFDRAPNDEAVLKDLSVVRQNRYPTRWFLTELDNVKKEEIELAYLEIDSWDETRTQAADFPKLKVLFIALIFTGKLKIPGLTEVTPEGKLILGENYASLDLGVLKKYLEFVQHMIALSLVSDVAVGLGLEGTLQAAATMTAAAANSFLHEYGAQSRGQESTGTQDEQS